MVNDTLLDPDLTRALCILHYQTLGSLKLHYLHHSSPPRRRERKVRGKEKRATRILTRALHRVYFSLQVRLILCRQLPITHFSLSLLFSSPFLSPFPSFCTGNLLNITTPESAMEHPRRSCPQGFFGEILETHHRGHSSLLPSHFNRLNCVDLRFMD